MFLSTPEEVLAHLEAIGDQAAPHGNGRTAAETLCGAIASADVFWYDCDPAFADVMEQCRKAVDTPAARCPNSWTPSSGSTKAPWPGVR